MFTTALPTSAAVYCRVSSEAQAVHHVLGDKIIFRNILRKTELPQITIDRTPSYIFLLLQ